MFVDLFLLPTNFDSSDNVVINPWEETFSGNENTNNNNELQNNDNYDVHALSWDFAPTSKYESKSDKIFELLTPEKIMSDDEIKNCLLQRARDNIEINKILSEQKKDSKIHKSEKIVPLKNDVVKTNLTRRLLQDLLLDISYKININTEYIDYSVVDNENNALIHWACLKKNIYLLELCIKNNCDVNLKGKDGILPLIYLFYPTGQVLNKKNFYYVTKLLLDNNCDVDLINKNFDLLKIACNNYLHSAPFELLINAGVRVNSNDISVTSALNYTFRCIEPSYEVFELLLSNGATFVYDENFDIQIEIKTRFVNKFRENFFIMLQKFLPNITEKWLHRIIVSYFV